MEAWEYDDTYNSCHRVHDNLPRAAIFLDNASLMRNAYADEALNENMLALMLVSRESKEVMADIVCHS